MVGTPVAFLLSLLGVFLDKRKGRAVAGLIISGIFVVIFLVSFAMSVAG